MLLFCFAFRSVLPSLGNYQPQATTSQKMLKIFAFASSLVELLAVGLQTYNRARYRQFVKRIGHMIRLVFSSGLALWIKQMF